MRKVLTALIAGSGLVFAGEGIQVNGFLTTYFLYISQDKYKDKDEKIPDEKKSIFDAGTAIVSVSKKKGKFGYTFIGGAYAIPVIGALDSENNDALPTTGLTTSAFSGVPVAYIDYSLTSSLTLSLGRLPTIIGYETFATALNDYIQRGRVWNFQPVVHHGIRLSYGAGNISATLGVNDGLFSLGPNFKGTTLTPGVELGVGTSLGKNLSISLAGLYIDNGALDDANDKRDYQGNLIVAYGTGNITVAIDALYLNSGDDKTSDTGVALHAKYEGKKFGVAGRIEYLDGDNEKATTFTITPSYKHGNYFVRLEGAYYNPQSGDGVASGGFEAGFTF